MFIPARLSDQKPHNCEGKKRGRQKALNIQRYRPDETNIKTMARNKPSQSH